MITFIAQHQFWTAVAGYWILSAAVSLLPKAALARLRFAWQQDTRLTPP